MNRFYIKYAAERLADSSARFVRYGIPIRCVDNCNESIWNRDAIQNGADEIGGHQHEDLGDGTGADGRRS